MNLLLNVMISLLIGLFYLMQQQNAAVQGFVNLADVECGVPSVNVNRRYRRIVDGDDATEGEFPWMVSIRIRVSSSHICGGSLIHKNWVLTAAHCVDYLKLSEIEVVVGQLNLIVKGHSSKVWKRRIQQVVLHPSYVTSSNTVSTGDDIALVRLKPIRSNWNNQLVRPICLSDDRRLTSNKKRLPFSTMVMMATVTGWGRSDVSEINTSSNISRIKALQKVDLPIVSNEQCQLWYRREDWSMKIKASHLCAGFESGGKDSCLEDSGGPLMIKQNGRFVIVGIVSAGIGCGLPRTPGIYTRVSSYIDWIKSVLTKNQ